MRNFHVARVHKYLKCLEVFFQNLRWPHQRCPGKTKEARQREQPALAALADAFAVPQLRIRGFHALQVGFRAVGGLFSGV